MKGFLTTLAYIGLAFVIVGTTPAFMSTIDILTTPESARVPTGPYDEWTGLLVFLGWVVTSFGALLALIGGLLARPRYLWISLIAIGVICGLFFEMYVYQSYYATDIDLILEFMLPGVACIIGGLVMRKIERKQAQS